MKLYLAKYFPKHRMRIELFFGAGGSYFYLPEPKYSVVNDLDDDVTNLYLVIQNRSDELIKAIEEMPMSESLLKYWKKNTETDPIRKALRFLLISNMTYMGKGDTFSFALSNIKQTTIDAIPATFKKLRNVKIMNCDFREVLPKITFSPKLNDKKDCFLYLDPVYLDTNHNYRVPDWKEKDTIDCLDIMVNCGIKSAMSEFDHPFVVSEAIKRNLNIIYLKERANIKNRRTEILITNYQVSQASFDFS